jgi:PAS domain S-box-containing protein
VTGWTLAEAAGVPLDTVFRIVNEETRRTVENPATRALREGLVVGLANHTLLIARDGTERPIDDSAAPIRNARGEVAGVVLVFRDITDRRKAERAFRESEERFRLLVEGTRDYAIFLLDPGGNVVSWNPGAERIKGYRADEIIGRHFSCFYPPEAVAARWPEHELERAAAEGRFEDEGWRVRKDGSKFWANVVITALRDEAGNLQGFSKITRDLTERQQAEARVRESETRYRRLFEASRDGILLLDPDTGQVLSANPSASDLHRRKDQFLAMLSHELRNPLAPLLNVVHLLRLQGCGNPIHEQARGIIERQVGQLSHLVNELLEVSRITTGRIRLHKETVDVRGVVERAVETARPLVEQRRHELSVSQPLGPVWLHADPHRIEQVVVNLLNNAAKYTEERGRIWLTVQQEGEEVVLRVRDTGVGIAPELVPRIFDLFTQAERSLDRSQGGLGIGLTLVHKLVELHGGKVEVVSVLGQGSEFVVRLPVRHQPAGAAEPAPTATGQPPARRSRVLVVDDNADAADSIAVLLRTFGHDVRVAYSGPAALEAAAEHQPDVVLLDIGLPEMDGYELARRLRQNPRLENVSLVAVTGYGQESDRLRSHLTGFDCHLTKPVTPKQLQEVLASADRQPGGKPELS